MQSHDATESGRRWWQNPWIMLLAGFTCLILLWIGIGLWKEHQTVVAQTHFENHSHASIDLRAGTWRHPRWIPESLMSQLPRIQSLQIPAVDMVTFDGPVERADLVALDRLPEVTRIRMSETSDISDEMFDEMIRNRPLTTLVFAKPRRLSPSNLDVLADHGTLSMLGPIAGPFDESSLHKLGRVRQLGVLTLHGPAEGAEGIASLAKLPLQHLHWSDSELDDEQFAALSPNPNLRVVGLRKTRLTEKSWPLLESLKLESLTIESPHISPSLAQISARQSQLRSLELKGGTIGDEGVREIAKLPQLSWLALTSKGLTSASAAYLGESKSLRELIIFNGSTVDDQWIAGLARCKLSELTLINSQVTDQGLQHLRGNASLRNLTLPGSRITDEAIDVLNTIPNLWISDLRNTAITDQGIARLKLGGGVLVGGTKVTSKGAQEFLSRNPGARLTGVDGESIPPGWRAVDLSAEPGE